MIDAFKLLLGHQFEASLCTLAHCVEAASADAWSAPVARYPFCQVAFHTLFFADYYLGPDADSFRSQPFHTSHRELFHDYEQLERREPTCVYEKPPIREYLQFCRGKAAEVVGGETEATLAAPARFARRDFSRAELYVYNIRHIQHHAAQLVLRLRLDGTVDIPWIGSGWREPPPTAA